MREREDKDADAKAYAQMKEQTHVAAARSGLGSNVPPKPEGPIVSKTRIVITEVENGFHIHFEPMPQHGVLLGYLSSKSYVAKDIAEVCEIINPATIGV